ncbi:MAG: alkene reductase [Zetaproteobacteria bacterium CG12_big_fil_rev_8_21_14_0_65_55_1124]|nr:MAG: alkene reductase [Zetaproteobacteria bacterium CG1_02_55_237]PIS20050.1 MAG: alkene reductase [Zetaproteobacteria bacterium CG08_land_8_20_14_0_20_55_17]PIW42083.1 MAG: alkene reductase [Zetaproteobacteria bacterium CG12_big_fil_rev_8_21_14_0_65_55_1124]PIY52905.1 MAG: alkene reductase [Zetaproteobacteria bacterium CG_4_10_14_0_8_um_filter_55_43]PIZ39552.1 MAG: alkene reductase [Zetaproteobacteria bacterium CG_4_10_14_0_2_um_filter_55_20]PJB79902.1 MAG: alkene reductase [Zetaproteobact
MSNNLFSPVTLGQMSLANRVAMAPMTRNRAPGGIPTALMAEYYVQRAEAGLIITEGAQISDQAIGYPATPGIHSQAQVDGWKQVTDAVHANGGHIFVQLWHCGRVSHPDYHEGALPVAPSAIKPAGQAFTYTGLQDFVTPRALEFREIPEIVEQYRHAAAMAIKAGFDGVEIHSANGYLLDQFLRDGSNQRSDAYGGSIANRARLLLEVTGAVCDEIGADKVGVRISPVNGFNDMHDSDPQSLFNHVATELAKIKPAFLHVVEVSMAGEVDHAVDMQQIRQCFKGAYMANGSYDKARGNAAIASGAADMVAYGIPYLANPDLIERFRRNAPLNAPDMATFYGGDAKGYTDYPTLDGG